MSRPEVFTNESKYIRKSWQGFAELLRQRVLIAGFGLAAAGCNDHSLAETFFAVRRYPSPSLPSVVARAKGVYVADKGFAGEQVHHFWYKQCGAQVVSPPHQRSKVYWSKAWRRWLARLR